MSTRLQIYIERQETTDECGARCEPVKAILSYCVSGVDSKEQRKSRILTDTQEEERVSLFTFLGLTGTGHNGDRSWEN